VARFPTNSSASRIASRHEITATKDAALIRKTHDVPIAAMRTPATAGPVTRAALKVAELRPIAFGSSDGPTSSVTKACRTGESMALPTPSMAASK
jgi:hypothetical protein